MSDAARDVDLVQMVADLRAEVARINLERAAMPAIPPGLILPCPMRTLPRGFLWADGSAVTRSSYPALFDAVVPILGTTTVTIASPGVFTLASHGLAVGDAVYLTTTGALPTGLAANTIYYVMTVPTTDTFTLGGSRSTTAVTSAKNTSGTQSGTHSLYYCPWGLGNGSTTFNVPDYRGVTIVGADAIPGGSDRGLLDWLNTIGVQGGAQTHTLTGAESGVASHGHNDTFAVDKGTLAASSSVTEPNSGQGHRHSIGSTTNVSTTGTDRQEPGSGTSATSAYAKSGITVSTTISGAPGITGTVSNASAANAGSAHNNVQPSTLTYFVVKT